MSDGKPIRSLIWMTFWSSASIGLGIWLATWSLEVPPQPSTQRELRYTDSQSRIGYIVAYGAANIFWALLELVWLSLSLGQAAVIWKVHVGRFRVNSWEHDPVLWIVWIIALLARVITGVPTMNRVSDRANARYYARPPAIDPDRRVAFIAGFAVSVVVQILAMIGHARWAAMSRTSAVSDRKMEEIRDIIAEHEAERDAATRLQTLRQQQNNLASQRQAEYA
ncbi:hypothetical protein OC835_004908 [Tilletia horrida]|nr:hypothetical protein OC835_004908 [Tilletia horrida]